MKKLENLLLRGCGYTILITVLFFLVAILGEYTNAAIDLATLSLILVFGIIISATDLVLGAERLKRVFRVMIHYSVLLLAFFFVFILAGKLRSGGASAVFAAIVIFTFLYAFIFAITYLIKRLINRADSAIDKNAATKKKRTAAEYTPIYKDKT